MYCITTAGFEEGTIRRVSHECSRVTKSVDRKQVQLKGAKKLGLLKTRDFSIKGKNFDSLSAKVRENVIYSSMFSRTTARVLFQRNFANGDGAFSR